MGSGSGELRGGGAEGLQDLRRRRVRDGRDHLDSLAVSACPSLPGPVRVSCMVLSCPRIQLPVSAHPSLSGRIRWCRELARGPPSLPHGPPSLPLSCPRIQMNPPLLDHRIPDFTATAIAAAIAAAAATAAAIRLGDLSGPPRRRRPALGVARGSGGRQTEAE